MAARATPRNRAICRIARHQRGLPPVGSGSAPYTLVARTRHGATVALVTVGIFIGAFAAVDLPAR
jgi:hypothetical protein